MAIDNASKQQRINEAKMRHIQLEAERAQLKEELEIAQRQQELTQAALAFEVSDVDTCGELSLSSEDECWGTPASPGSPFSVSSPLATVHSPVSFSQCDLLDSPVSGNNFLESLLCYSPSMPSFDMLSPMNVDQLYEP